MKKYQSLSIFHQPRQLLAFDDKDKLSVKEDVLEEIRQIDIPLNVVAVVGPYRTGKSYLANRLLKKKKGFDLGSGVEAVTKGIWICCQPHPVKTGQVLVVLDTEGLGDPTQPESDSHLLIMAVLLCNTLIYNMQGKIDRDALENLSFAATLSTQIRAKQRSTKQSNDEDILNFLPKFVFTIRDFTLDLEVGGKKVTEDEYLDHCLQNAKPATQIQKMTRDWIQTKLKNRKCFVLETPGVKNVLKKLEDTSDDTLVAGFVEQLKIFIKYVHEDCEPMCLVEGTPVNGPSFLELVKHYIEEINSGHIPCIESATERVITSENNRAVAAAVDTYIKGMQREALPPYPDDEALNNAHRNNFERAKNVYKDIVVKDDQDRFNKHINTEYERIKKDDSQASMDISKLALDTLAKEVNRNIGNGHYLKPGGYQEYKRNVEQLEKRYNATQDLGREKIHVFKSFVTDRRNERKLIRNADELLTIEEESKFATKIKRMVETVVDNPTVRGVVGGSIGGGLGGVIVRQITGKVVSTIVGVAGGAVTGGFLGVASASWFVWSNRDSIKTLPLGGCCLEAPPCSPDNRSFGKVKCEQPDDSSSTDGTPNKTCQCNEANNLILSDDECVCMPGYSENTEMQNGQETYV